MRYCREKGFTLAELLAVVIIVGLMATFGIGYYRQSTEQARFNEVLAQANAEAEKLNQDILDNALGGEAIVLDDTNLVTVNQCQVAHAANCTSIYAIEVLSDYVLTLPKGRIACIGLDGENGKGQAFCEAMGFRECAERGDEEPNAGKMGCLRP